MGGVISKSLGPLVKSKKKRQIVFVGLENAGKTTIFQWITSGQFESTTPTVGFSMKTKKMKNLELLMWDLGGQYLLRSQWRHYYAGAFVVIFVIDGSNRAQLADASHELRTMMREPLLRSTHLLILLNKMDLPDVVTPTEVVQLMGLDQAKEMPYHIQPTCGATGDGIADALNWVVDRAGAKKKGGKKYKLDKF